MFDFYNIKEKECHDLYVTSRMNIFSNKVLSDNWNIVFDDNSIAGLVGKYPVIKFFVQEDNYIKFVLNNRYLDTVSKYIDYSNSRIIEFQNEKYLFILDKINDYIILKTPILLKLELSDEDYKKLLAITII